MSSQNFPCPSCGAPLEVRHRFSRMVICQYCNQTAAVTPAGLDPTGQAPELVRSPSIFSLGATGRLRQDPFRVLGRLRYQYDGGFWDEWFVETDSGSTLWVQEDDGEVTVYEKDQLTSPVPPFDEVRVGSMIPLNDSQLFVTERTDAMIAGGEGELRFRVLPGMDVHCVDGNAGGVLYSIEYTPEEINLSRGTDLDRGDLSID